MVTQKQAVLAALREEIKAQTIPDGMPIWTFLLKQLRANIGPGMRFTDQDMAKKVLAAVVRNFGEDPVSIFDVNHSLNEKQVIIWAGFLGLQAHSLVKLIPCAEAEYEQKNANTENTGQKFNNSNDDSLLREALEVTKLEMRFLKEKSEAKKLHGAESKEPAIPTAESIEGEDVDTLPEKKAPKKLGPMKAGSTTQNGAKLDEKKLPSSKRSRPANERG